MRVSCAAKSRTYLAVPYRYNYTTMNVFLSTKFDVASPELTLDGEVITPTQLKTLSDDTDPLYYGVSVRDLFMNHSQSFFDDLGSLSDGHLGVRWVKYSPDLKALLICVEWEFTTKRNQTVVLKATACHQGLQCFKYQDTETLFKHPTQRIDIGLFLVHEDCSMPCCINKPILVYDDAYYDSVAWPGWQQYFDDQPPPKPTVESLRASRYLYQAYLDGVAGIFTLQFDEGPVSVRVPRS